ncbi:MAG: nucleotidyltransferase/DNA polymerase protein [Parcubacteria group bacterium]|nr:nucleotidyltransferase/DNA polymerase protein [Parcubacteria group bacterium]
MPLNRSYPRAIVHFDADSFFASVEQVMNHNLRGKAVVTGGERGAATSVSIEGKKLGLYRGMSLRDMKKMCPDVVIVSSDYTSYSIFARRMYSIAREFTPHVEEYSIDECFADITGLRSQFHTSYEGIAQLIQKRLHAELGITFGVGLGPSKTIAKIASKLNKPAGFTPIPTRAIPSVLSDIPIGSLWGVGYSTSFKFEKLGVHTALDFAQKTDGWLKEHGLAKPYRDIWLELNGAFVRKLATTPDDSIGSILQSRTFTPTNDRRVLFSQLAKNIEGACAKARRHGVRGSSCRFYLKTQEFTYAGKNLSMSIPLSDPREFLRLIEAHFDSVYIPGTMYRASGFGLYAITSEHAIMPDLFGETVRVESQSKLIETMDSLNQKYGKHTLHLGVSHSAVTNEDQRQVERRKRSRPRMHMSLEQKRKTINLPYLGVVR